MSKLKQILKSDILHNKIITLKKPLQNGYFFACLTVSKIAEDDVGIILCGFLNTFQFGFF